MKIIKLSSRDDKTVDHTNFESDFNLKFQKGFAVTNIINELMAAGHKTVESINKELKERDIEIDSEVKKIVKSLVKDPDVTN